jgi:AraC family transcriptional regulator, regulatory protein of adaptative response / methylated-DNA-[protein]-cysteine methyltransferase
MSWSTELDTADWIRFAVGECSLGAVVVATSAKGICAILLGDDAAAAVSDLRERFPDAQPVGDLPRFEAVLAEVVAFIEAPARGLGLPLDPRGTAFQRRVWKALCQIPVGSTATYSDIARQLGAPKEAYLVGEACTANPIAVAIPCHRVVRKDGTFGGYRWGIKRKRALLQREAAA